MQQEGKNASPTKPQLLNKQQRAEDTARKDLNYDFLRCMLLQRREAPQEGQRAWIKFLNCNSAKQSARAQIICNLQSKTRQCNFCIKLRVQPQAAHATTASLPLFSSPRHDTAHLSVFACVLCAPISSAPKLPHTIHLYTKDNGKATNSE